MPRATTISAWRSCRRDSGAWTEEQSRKNFEMVSKLVNPGDAATSRLLLHPLAPEGGGDVFHSGGRQFADKNDPAWKHAGPVGQWAKAAK